MNHSDQFVVEEGYGLSAIKRSLVPVLIAITIIIMYQVNGKLAGSSSPVFSYSISGLFFLIGLIAFTFRRKTIFSKNADSIMTQWNFLFFKYKEIYPFYQIKGLELIIGTKRTDSNRISSGSSVQRYLHLNLNCEGPEGPKDEDHSIILYTSQDKEGMNPQAQRVSEYLGLKLITTDHRLKLDAAISDL